jgi:hypothetical protein
LVFLGWTSGAVDYAHVRERDQRPFNGDKFVDAAPLARSEKENDE